MAINNPVPGTPTQVAHPWRSVLRVFVAAAVAVGVRWLADRGLDLTALSEAMVDSISNALGAAALGGVQWLLTRPWMERFLSGTPFSTGVDTEPGRHVAGV